MKNKKATSMGLRFVIVLAITIAGALVYFLWLNEVKTFGEDFTDYAICKNSNIANAKMKLKIDNQVIEERRGNKCKTEYVDVPKDKELEFVAKKMAGCWDMYIEGKEELFDTEDNNYCAICSVLTFKDKKQVSGLTKYLMEKKAPNQGGKTYFQYMTRVIVTKEILTEEENEHLKTLGEVDTANPLAVMFVMGKDVNPGSKTGESKIVSGIIGSVIGPVTGLLLCGTGAGCVLGAFALGGATGYIMGSDYNPDRDTRILLWPYTNEDMNSLDCTILEGKDTLEIRK